MPKQKRKDFRVPFSTGFPVTTPLGALNVETFSWKPTGLCDLPDFFGPFQSWRTASVASVEQYRCLNSLGVR